MVLPFFSSETSAPYRDGMLRGIPVMLAALPFGILFGALAVDNGLSVGQAVLMSATIFAGASQMVGIDLFGKQVAPWLIVLSIFAVNFRHVLYSAAIGRHTRHWPWWKKAFGFYFLVDPQYAESERHVAEGKSLTFAWYMGFATVMYSGWLFGSWVGAEFGRYIPDSHALGLDYLLPIYFLGMVLDFRKRPLWLPVVLTSGVVSSLAFVYVGSPWHVSIGAVAGILLAAMLAPTARQPGGTGRQVAGDTAEDAH